MWMWYLSSSSNMRGKCECDISLRVVTWGLMWMWYLSKSSNMRGKCECDISVAVVTWGVNVNVISQ